MFTPEVYEAADLGTDPLRLSELAAAESNQVRVHVAKNASTPGEVLTRLADDSERDVRTAVAGNPLTPVEVLTRLADDSEAWVRMFGVAGNPSTPVEVLTRLAVDADGSVRDSLARNPSTPVNVLIQLADDAEVRVRAGVAGNPSTPVEILMRLVDDSAAYVRGGFGGGGVGGNPSTPVEVLRKLAADADDSVRQSVAGNPSTPVEVLTQLADDPAEGVRAAVAENSSTPAEILSAGTPWKDVEDLLTDPAWLAQLAVSENMDLRKRALLNPACPNEVREASGMVFLFAVQRAAFFNGRTNMMVTSRDFTRDLASPWVKVLDPRSDAEGFEVMCAAEIFGGEDVDARASNEWGNLVWCGSGAPSWWSDWSLLEDFLGSDTVAALTRGDDFLFEDNEFKAAERVAFASHEATTTAWKQIRADLRTVFATGERSEWGSEETVPSRMSSSQELREVADRWLREDSWRELSATAHRAVLSALARHPNAPTAVLEELAVSDEESVRWLVTRNPSATDAIRAAAVLTGVDDEKFTEEDLPDEDWMDVSIDGVHVGVHASAWTREEFTERFPEVFDDPDGDWVSSDGRITIDSATDDIPDEINDFLQDEGLPRGYDWYSGSVTEYDVF